MIFGYFRDPVAHFGGSGVHSGVPGAHSGGPEAHSGSPERHCQDFWDYCDFGRRPGAKGDTHFESHFNIFLIVCCVLFGVFSSACFFDFV